MNLKQKFGIIALSLAINSVAVGAIDVYHFDNPRQEAQYRALIEEFRCPKMPKSKPSRLGRTDCQRFKTKNL